MKIELKGYEIKEKIYESQRSLIYRAVREKDNLPVIIKVLNKEYPTIEEVARFQKEIQITKKLNVQGVLKPLELIKHQNTFIGVFNDIGGKELEHVFSNGMSLEEFLNFAINVTKILSEIHSKQIIHKDINPRNIIYNRKTREVRIIDFGISVEMGPLNQEINNRSILEGSLPYISPEQTGRINRGLDYRTDLYSLGITFYETLSGQRPFEAQDNMDWIHCHIAKKPVKPSDIRPDIPNIISNIIITLINKNPEDRYQSAFGLAHDLKECYKQLQSNGSINDFVLRTKDEIGKLQFSNKLYGREKEKNILNEKFMRILHDKKEMVIVYGHEGIGKSLLVKDLQKSVIEHNGYYIEGVANEFSKNVPYCVIGEAIKQLINRILIESEEKLLFWKEKIEAALGPNGQLITNIIPDLEKIIGIQPEIKKFSPDQIKNKFNTTFLDFIKVFSSKEHPIVIFIDNLHFSDLYSLQVLQNIFNADEISSLMLVGAYRDDEVLKGHQLYTDIKEIINNKEVEKIELKMLSQETIKKMIAGLINSEEKYTAPLAEIIFRKTKGNPYFIKELIKRIYQDKILVFNKQEEKWIWKLDKIKSIEISKNVLNVIIKKIAQMSEDVKEILKIATCVGITFEFKALVCISDFSIQKIQEMVLNIFI
ncbi:AAA family ATPase [Candidatus Margulisiibacteriota bacterium]